VADRIIYSGDAGTRFTNDTGKVLYQFIAALQNTCGVCLQYHLKISRGWPIPIHYNCRCIQRLVKPGADAPHEFVDYRKLLDGFDESQKTAAIGASNYRLLKSGLATWDDIVTPNRVRDFREVVAKKRLSVETMTKHGVSRYQATKAYDAVHTTEHQHAERQRAALLKNLTAAGVSHDTLVGELSKRLAGRVTIAAGPTGAMVGRPQDVGGPAWGGGRLPGTGASDAAVLAKLISGWRPTPKAKPLIPKVEAKAKEEAKPKPAPEQPLSDNPMIARAQRIGNGEGVQTLVVDNEEQARKLWGDKVDNLAAQYYPGNDTIVINARSKYWDPGEVEAAHKRGWLSSDDPNHIINHELGHRAHRQAIGPERWDQQNTKSTEGPGKTRIEKEVSQYAAVNRAEFVAEVYAGMKSGKTYDPKIMEQFRVFGGVAPK
jgi:hypothetical protein